VRIDERFRLPFSERDFLTDSAGDDNRDPFRSFVVRQGKGPRELKGSSPIQPTDVCTEKNSKAPGYSIRDLRLIGLLLRGTSSYAQFRDPAGYGWIVRLRDCLGKEKGIVDKIGAGFVTLEVLPESAAANNEGQAERRDIQLHPDELPAGESMTTEPPRETTSPEARPPENQP
jgi:Tfp pilus assembly protein PilP